MWLDKNCNRCKKNVEFIAGDYIVHCDIENELALASVMDGNVPDEIYKRMGDPMDFDCPEREDK
jgi:hypothetical protein